MEVKETQTSRNSIRQPRNYLLAFVLTAGIILIAFAWFVMTLRSSVYETQLTNMNELAAHDITTIQNFLDDDWKSLSTTASKASLRHLDSDQAIADFIREEQIQSDFEDIYLIDDNFNAYDTTGVYPADRETIVNTYLTKEHNMSSRDILSGIESSSTDYLYSGVSLNGITINGHTIIEIVGKLDLKKIQDRIRISNYNGKGYSSVFDEEGRMIIGINAGGQHLTNYYDYLEKSTNLGKEGTANLKEKAAASESFTETFVDQYTGITNVVSFQTIEELNWHFIMSVPKSVFDSQNQQMLNLLLIMIGIIFAALLLMMLFLMRSQIQVAQQKEKEKQREALEDALEQAKTASRAKTAFLFNMSHDIRTPMNAVIGLSTLAKKHLNEPDKMQFYMEQIGIAGKQLLSIINNILELSRIESDKVRMDEEVTDTTEIFEGIRTVFENQSRAKDLHLSFTNEIQNRWMYMDRTHVEEIITNLVSNAMKYTEDGGSVSLILSEKQGSDEDHTVLHAVIEDTGIGMSEEYQKKMFEQFEREQTSTVSRIQGTGLGLSIVKRLIDLMNGSILVRSRQGEGTCINVDIQLRIAESPITVISDAELAEEISFEGLHILLAEDIDLNAMIATDMLEPYGFTVDRVTNGQECVDMLEKAESDYYDLILMDIQMPVMDGFQATRVIRRMEDPNKSSLPILAMTANAFQEDRINVLRAGMDAHIGKPLDVDQMIATLQNILRSRKLKIQSNDMDAFRQQYERLGCTCGYFIYDAEGEEKITFADEKTATIFGCNSVEDFMQYTNGSFKGMVHPDDYDNLESVIEVQLHQNSRSIDLVDFRIIRKDGEVRKVKDIGYSAYNGNKKQFYVYIVDVTDIEEAFNDHLQNIEELLAENGLNRHDLSNDPQGIYIADATRRIIYWNKSAERITGYKPAEIQGMNCFHTALKHQNREGVYMCSGMCPLMRSIVDEAQVSEELTAYCSNGTRKLLTVRTDPLYKDGEIFGAIEYFDELEKK